MYKRKWLWTALLTLPLAVGLVYGHVIIINSKPQQGNGYICPLTGEKLPCPECCPLNKQK